jgi:hypothetical protein
LERQFVHNRVVDGWGWWVLVLMAQACGVADDPSVDEPSDDTQIVVDTDGSAVGVDSDGPVEVPRAQPLDAQQQTAIADALTRFAVDVATMDFETVRRAVASMREQETGACPTWDVLPLGPIWNGDCTTNNGTRFYGNFVIVETGWQDAADELVQSSFMQQAGPMLDAAWSPDEAVVDKVEGYFATCSVEHDTQMVAMSGFYHDLHVSAAGLSIRETLWEGEVIDAGQVGSWAQRGQIPNLRRTWVDSADGGRAHGLHGALSWSEAEAPSGYATVWASSVWMANEAGQDPCVSEPLGTLSVRDTRGSWFDVVFDGDDGGTCDGCGEVSTTGVVVGTVCPDLSALLTQPAEPVP